MDSVGGGDLAGGDFRTGFPDEARDQGYRVRCACRRGRLGIGVSQKEDPVPPERQKAETEVAAVPLIVMEIAAALGISVATAMAWWQSMTDDQREKCANSCIMTVFTDRQVMEQ